MARANAYGTNVPVGALRGLVRSLRGAPGQASHNQAIDRFEPLVRRSIPIVIGIFLLVLAVLAWLHAREARLQAINSAIADMELVGIAVATDLDHQAQRMNHADTASLTGLSVPYRAMAGGRRVIVSDASDHIIAKFPANIDASGSLSDHFGPAQLMTSFAEKAGVMRIGMANGEDVITHVHSLASPLGQVALVHPVSSVLGEWQAQSIRTLLTFFFTALVISALTAAFLWQAKRASSAEVVCDRVRDRVDTALSRGRCGLWDWDIARGRIYWSSSMYEVLGMEERSEFISFGEVNSLIHPDDGDLNKMAEMLARSEVNAIDHVFRLRNAAQDWVWLRARAEIVRETLNEGAHLVGIAVDITEQRRMAEQNATADLRLREAIETVSEALVLWDAENRLVMCNSKFQSLHSLPPQAVRPGNSYRNVMAHGTPLEIQRQVSLADRPQTGARSYEVALGDGRWLQINERRTKDGGYVSVGTDISKLKCNEAQLMDSERKLTATVADLLRYRQTLELQAQQLAEMAEKYLDQKAAAESANLAKSHFLANMSHELRTPLNHIIGFAEMMQQKVFGPLGAAKYDDYCAYIQQSGRYLHELVSDVLDMSSLEAGRVQLTREEFDVSQAVEMALQDVRQAALAKEIELVCEPANGSKLVADRNSVTKILTTLLRNAVKFTPEGGRVTVRARQVGAAVNIYVEDTGIGMTQETVQKIGRPFEQPGPLSKDGMKGSGLGLAIARSLIELHHGSLRIRSTPGAGTIVQVHLAAPKKPNLREIPLQIAV